MRLISSRDPQDQASFAQAIQAGMAGRGGLFVPAALPRFQDLPDLLRLPFQERSVELIQRLLGDEFSAPELAAAVSAALDFPVPLVPVTPAIAALELFHGPTLAFKDFGARFLARMLELVARREGARLRTVLTATSGDTGAAVAHAFLGLEGFQTVVLYPKGRVTELQERQFATLGGNVRALAVSGSFDDCQALVKGCFEDPQLCRRIGLTSANSINPARLLAQLLYYYEGVARFQDARPGEAPVLAVPSGNFGNLCAGLWAQRTGLPVAAFVLASNANRTVPEYLDSGQYRPRASVATLSSAMDVGSPSNWERIEALFQGDLQALRRELRWGSRTDAETRAAAAELRAAGYQPEPHGTVAYSVLKACLRPGEAGLFLATAHPAKFPGALPGGPVLELPAALAALLGRPLLSRPMAVDLAALKGELG